MEEQNSYNSKFINLSSFEQCGLRVTRKFVQI